MTDRRWQELMSDIPGVDLTDQESDAGWHWCNEFDGLLVGPGMEEERFCGPTCPSQFQFNLPAKDFE